MASTGGYIPTSHYFANVTATGLSAPVSGNSIDRSSAGTLAIGNANATTITMGTSGIVSVTAASGNIAVNTNKFTVAGASGNIVSAGTLTLQPTSSQIVLGASAHLVTISSTAIAAAAQTLTIPDPLASCNIQLGIKQVITTGASSPITITAAQSGSIFNVVQQGGAIVANLPTAAAGLEYEFILSNNAAGTFSIVSAGVAGTMKGQLYSSNGVAAVLCSTAGFNLSNAIQARFAAAGVAGDWIRVRCSDGTNWMAYGHSGATNGNLFAT
jgi:hypothetical protein